MGGGTGKAFGCVRGIAKTSDPAAGTRGSASFEMAAGKPHLEANLQRGRENLQAWPARTRQNNSRPGSRKFPCLAQTGQRCLVSVAHFTAAQSRGLGRNGSRRGSFR